MKKLLFRFSGILIFLIGGYWFYPKTDSGPITIEYPVLPTEAHSLENFIKEKESKIKNLRPDNEARIVWYDSTKAKTPFSLVYLHGYSASQFEGEPLHRETAAKYGMNLYLSRLAGHGIGDKESLKNLTADEYMDSAIEAIQIGKQIGQKVILMGTSTGATVGLPAMAFDSEIAAGIFYSPNIELVDQNTQLLRKPFGLALARLIVGSNYHQFDGPETVKKYWTNQYRLEGVITLRELLDKTMTAETFEKINQPALFLAYYENEEKQDPVVSVAAMEDMFEQLGTDDSKKILKKLPFVNNHVMACRSHSKDLNSVRKETNLFLEDVLKLMPAQQN